MIFLCKFQRLSELSNYHEFCRLLARLKTNYQLGELVMVDHYRDVIQLIAKFTVESLQVFLFDYLLTYLILPAFMVKFLDSKQNPKR